MSEVNNTLLMQKLVRVLEKQDQEAERISSGGGGSNGGTMEPRIAKLESDVGHIGSGINEIKQDVRDIKKDAREDFRILFAAMIAVALALAWIMAKGFKWL